MWRDCLICTLNKSFGNSIRGGIHHTSSGSIWFAPISEMTQNSRKSAEVRKSAETFDPCHVIHGLEQNVQFYHVRHAHYPFYWVTCLFSFWIKETANNTLHRTELGSIMRQTYKYKWQTNISPKCQANKNNMGMKQMNTNNTNNTSKSFNISILKITHRWNNYQTILIKYNML